MTACAAVSAVTEYAARLRRPCATLRELAAIRTCRAGDTFATADARNPPAGATTVGEREDPAGASRDGVFATVAPRDGEVVAITAYVRADPAAYEGVRAAPRGSIRCSRVLPVERIATDAQFATLRRAMFAGAAIVMALIGLSLLLTALEQLRERRRLLAVLVAFGTRRSTLSWSLLWQSALPVGLGLAVAVLTGLGLGAVLLASSTRGVRVALARRARDGRRRGGRRRSLVTAATLPVLFRTMRPEGCAPSKMPSVGSLHNFL